MVSGDVTPECFVQLMHRADCLRFVVDDGGLLRLPGCRGSDERV